MPSPFAGPPRAGVQDHGEPLSQREGLPVQLKAAQYSIMELCQVIQQALQAADLRFHPRMKLLAQTYFLVCAPFEGLHRRQ